MYKRQIKTITLGGHSQSKNSINFNKLSLDQLILTFPPKFLAVRIKYSKPANLIFPFIKTGLTLGHKQASGGFLNREGQTGRQFYLST